MLIYLSPTPIERLKDYKYLRAKNIVEAIQKITTVQFEDAYIFNMKLPTEEERILIRRILFNMKDKLKHIHFCLDMNLPYIEGISVINKVEGFRQIL